MATSQARRNILAERLDKQWHELRRHATIVTDPDKLLRLTAELDRRKRLADAAGKRNGN
jgi:hypothetical protein